MKALKAIALNTFRETVRDKLLYSLVAFAVIVLGASLLAGSVSLGQDTRVVQDFGLMAILVFQLIISLFIGTQLVWREVEHKTIYMVLSKPVSRNTFYLGKFFGLCLTLLVTGLVMGGLFLILVGYKTHTVQAVSIIAISYTILEAWLLTAVGLLFSAFTTPLASAVYTFCLALIGHSSATIWIISQKSGSIIKGLLEGIYYLLPNLEKFNYRNDVVFNLPPDGRQTALVALYFLGYTIALLLLGMAAFRRDEF